MTIIAGRTRDPQLIRLPHQNKTTGETRQFLVYLPADYDVDQAYRWPVIFFLHGGGERGDGQADLDYVLLNGPLGEAWIRHRNLPFVMIGPQLPVLGMDWQLQLRAGVPKPVRLATPPALLSATERPTQPILRASDLSPAVFDVTETWGDSGFPGGWQLIEENLITMLDTVLDMYRTDPNRVYLTGLSYGGNGTWHMAMTYPERWAAIAPICGDGNSALAHTLAIHQLPIWMFHGGRDTLNKPQWAYDMANALEHAGHQSIRFTVHEDCGHDCWTRVYGGYDLYDWFLQHKR